MADQWRTNFGERPFTVGLTDTTGNLVQRYQYDPYGEVSAQNLGFTNPYQYTGRENDGNGLYFYRSRYYNPIMKRFVGEDLVGFGSGQSNFYAYVGASPAMYRDPTGKFIPEAVAGAAVGAVWGLASGYFSGDTGGQLWTDAFEGLAVGGLAGLTDDASLLEGASGYAIRAGIAAAGEAGCQKSNYGCVKNWGDVFIAGGTSGLGDLGGDAFHAISSEAGGALSNVARAIDAGAGGTIGGITQTMIGQQEHLQEGRMEENSDFRKLEEGLH